MSLTFHIYSLKLFFLMRKMYKRQLRVKRCGDENNVVTMYIHQKAYWWFEWALQLSRVFVFVDGRCTFVSSCKYFRVSSSAMFYSTSLDISVFLACFADPEIH